MLSLLLLLAASHPIFAQLDTSCTEVDATGNLIIAQSAVQNCQNQMSLTACELIFSFLRNRPPTVAGVAANGGRPDACYLDVLGAPNAEIKKAALTYCPQYCGFCCLTLENNCTNSLTPRIDCGSITNEMCQSPLWRDIIAQDCPSACGFCLLRGCIDSALDCVTQPTICSNTELTSFVETNCQRTCGLCGNSSTTTTVVGAVADCDGGVATCTDRNSYCAQWNRNGFCASPFYTEDRKREYCAATCQLCSSCPSTAITEVSVAATAVACTDRSFFCSVWKRNGFCDSLLYTEDNKRNYCAATCVLC